MGLCTEIPDVCTDVGGVRHSFAVDRIWGTTLWARRFHAEDCTKKKSHHFSSACLQSTLKIQLLAVVFLLPGHMTDRHRLEIGQGHGEGQLAFQLKEEQGCSFKGKQLVDL